MAKPFGEGDMGFRSLETVIEAFRMRAAWTILTFKSKWLAFIRNKYFRNQ